MILKYLDFINEVKIFDIASVKGDDKGLFK